MHFVDEGRGRGTSLQVVLWPIRLFCVGCVTFYFFFGWVLPRFNTFSHIFGCLRAGEGSKREEPNESGGRNGNKMKVETGKCEKNEVNRQMQGPIGSKE